MAATAQSGWQCKPNPNNASGWHCDTLEPQITKSNAGANNANQGKKTALPGATDPETINTRTAIARQQTAGKVATANNSCTNSTDSAQQSNDEKSLAFDFATQSALPILTSAKQVNAKAGKIEFEQDVEFKQGNITLRADHATLNTQSNTIFLRGNIAVTTPAGKLTGDSATINTSNNQSEVINAHYSLGITSARGDAAVIRTNAQQELEISSGSYTQCAGEKPIWRVKAGNIHIDNASHQGVAKHARLEIYNTPVIYVPYARFPVGDARQSGVLFPALANTGDGADITLPYYFNIADNFDATVSPRYKNEHGYLTELETRWLNRFDYWVLSGAYIENDDSIAQNTSSIDATRWLVSAQERGQFGDHIISSVNYTKISDIDYLRDLNTASLSVIRATHLKQQATLGYYSEAWSGGAKVQQFQTVDPNIHDDDKPLETLPALWLRYQSTEQPFRINTNAYARYDAFSHDQNNDADRSYGKLEFNFPLAWRSLKITPAVTTEHIDYAFKDDAPTTQTPSSLSFTASEASLALRMNFEKISNNKRKTLEPGLLYRYRKITDSANEAVLAPLLDSDWLDVNTNSLWRHSRYSGYDILEETDQLTAALTHRYFGTNGTEQLALSLGQIIYFSDVIEQGQQLKATSAGESARASTLIGAFDANISPHWQANGSALWNSEQNHMREGRFALHYRNTHQNGRQSLANLGYRFRGKNQQRSVLAQSIEQADFSFVSALGRRYGLIGRVQYDMRANSAIESLGGLEFESCCVKLRLVYREGLVYNVDNPADEERDRSLFLQIELKGLMGIGDSLENVLKASILGFGDDPFTY